MSKELDERWRALIKAGRAEWRPGMVAIACKDGAPYGDQFGGMQHRLGKEGENQLMFLPEDIAELEEGTLVYVPDWQDPATLGALLGLVREKWGIAHAFAARDDYTGRWRVWSDGTTPIGKAGTTEAGALIAALGAACIPPK
ncbi:MAG: hypothetical protein V3R87_12955 [Dehalococcoidia bacterium]